MSMAAPPPPRSNLQIGEAARRYDVCIREVLRDWDIALYPPPPIEIFGLGSIFTQNPDGSITTFTNNLMVNLPTFVLLNTKPLSLWDDAGNDIRPEYPDITTSGSIQFEKIIPISQNYLEPLRPDVLYNYQ
jgi:hypothetical protein